MGREELKGVIFTEYDEDDGRSVGLVWGEYCGADGGGSGGVARCLNAGGADGAARRGAAK